MDISSVNSDLIRGNVTTIILGSLWNRDRYGYDILKEIEQKSEGQYKLKQPTLYNQLKRLEKQGLISSYEGDPDDTGGGRRRYYSLTAEGRGFLEKERSEYEYSRTILDKLVSSRQFDFDTTPAPFNTDDLRPYTKKDNSDKAKVVYKEKEKVVVVERKVYIDADGNEISEEEAQRLAAEGGGGRAVSEEEYALIQAEKQAEIERIQAEKQAEIDRLEEEKQRELERLNAEKEEVLRAAEEEKYRELERLEAEKQEELERLRAEQEEELRRAEEARTEELERIRAEKQAQAELAAEERRAELERLQEEARLERERLEAEHAEEVERLEAEKAAAEEEYALKEAEQAARHEEEMERIRREQEEAEERFREEYARFEEEKRAEEERRAEAERIEAERKAELERIERERIEAEEKFAAERERFLAEKAEEEAKREAFERAEQEKRERAEREAREREEALRSQATMSLEDVFKELDARSEYAAAEGEDGRIIVEGAEWEVEAPLHAEPEPPAEAIAEEEEEKEPEIVPEPVSGPEQEAVEEEEETPQTASLDEIFRTLDAKSEYTGAEGEKDEYIVEGAEWHTPLSSAPAQAAPAADAETDREEAPEDAPEELSAEEEALAEEALRDDDEDERSDMLAELARLEAERKAELERIARELEEMRERLNAAPQTQYIYAEAPARTQTAVREERVTESYREEVPAEEPRRAPESTLSEVFRKIDERDAAEKEARESARAEAASDYAEAVPLTETTNEDKGEFVTSAVVNKRSEPFDYEKSEVDYRGFFSTIGTAETQEEKAKEPSERAIPRPEPDLKSRLYSEGFKMRSYDRRNTSEYYTFNFISANRLNRDCWLIVMAIFLVEAAVMWACTAREISYIYFLPIMAGGAALMLIPTFVWMVNPTRRKRADFNVKLSVLNRGMMLIELAVVLVLIAFFGVGVSVSDTVLILETMVLPVILLTNLPFSSLVYYGLYRSKRYHTA